MNNHEQQQHVISVREYLDSIPVELLIEILSRVPSKSIARFRCVSKFWRSILERPDFTELFQNRCPRILFTLEVYTKKKHSIYSNKEIFFFSSPQHTNPDENSCAVASRCNTYVPKYVQSHHYNTNTMLCGLVLCDLSEHWRRNACVICNHATGEYITLPKVLLEDTKTLPKVIPEIRRFFFGYDPISKQFKVLCITSSNIHQVLTLENGKCKWRPIESKFDFMERHNILGQICINGVLYFGPKFRGNSSVVCFDVRYEKFSIIKIGQDKVNEGPCTAQHTTLINFKGKLGILGTRGSLKMDFDLLVLEDVENHKWSKHSYEFPHLWNLIVRTYLLQIVGMTGTCELVFAPFWLSNPFYVFYYNFERNTFTRVSIHGFEEFSNKKIQVHAFVNYGENMKLFK